MQVFYADQFVLPLPEGHRFPMGKYRMLREQLAQHVQQVRLMPALRASDGELALAHSPAYIEAIASGRVDPVLMREIGFPWSEAMAERARRSVGATVAACRAAFREGIAANIAGGTHHAKAVFACSTTLQWPPVSCKRSGDVCTVRHHCRSQ